MKEASSLPSLQTSSVHTNSKMGDNKAVDVYLADPTDTSLCAFVSLLPELTTVPCIPSISRFKFHLDQVLYSHLNLHQSHNFLFADLHSI